jgi:DNA repair exonuclease SbcCD ATPase subunit
MAKGEAKVSHGDELDNALSYDDLLIMLNETDNYMCKKKEELRDLKRKYLSLQESYEELNTSHENLKETHEKLKEAHNTSLAQEVKNQASIGVGFDILNDESYAPSSSNPSCSSNDSSCMSDVFLLLL